MDNYIGHPTQICGVEEVTLSKGKGRGMTLLQIRNGKGLEITLSPDRCMDISRISFKGDNVGYFAPCGYVAPTYYDKDGAGFLKSFTAGFMTTCGLNAVGSPCTDNGENLPLHGTISNTPCESYSYSETETQIIITGIIRQASLFNDSYLLTREYKISKKTNTFEIADKVQNIGNTVAPCMMLYHINFGYPLLTENAKVYIPSSDVKARDSHAVDNISTRLEMEKPQIGYQECCYYYDVNTKDSIAEVAIFNPDIEKGAKISYDKTSLPFFTQWKMMGIKEYVLGLEPGNCTPDGRDVMKKNNTLFELKPDDEYKTNIKVTFGEKMEEIQCL